MTRREWHILAAVLELVGTIAIALSFDVGTQSQFNIGGRPIAVINVDSPVIFYWGWALLAGGLAGQVVLAATDKRHD